MRVCSRSELGIGLVQRVVAGADSYGMPREAVLTIGADGQVRAYWNECKHLPVTLDSGTGQFLGDGGHFLCRTHGARFRIDDGLCIDGPCEGQSLDALAVRIEGEDVHLDLE